MGGDLLELREAAAAAVALRDGRIDGGRGGADNKPLVRVLYGHAGWAPGQLEGEIAAGAWKCAPPPADPRGPRSLTTARLPICTGGTDADANALAWTFEAEGDAPTMWERATAAIDGSSRASE